MPNEIACNHEAIVPWIRLHRTEYQSLPDDECILAYTAAIKREYELIKPFLPAPATIKKILDIGCGLAGIDIFLQRHYPDAKIYLLDGDGPAINWSAGWNTNFLPFNSSKVTFEFLSINGVYPLGMWPCNTHDPLEADLVVSFLSWGFHYSLFKYAVRTPCAISTIRKGPNVDALFYQSEYHGKMLGKAYTLIHETEKYRLLKFSFDNITQA